MKPTVNDFVLSVATVNGSGSQSANNILLKTIFRMGIPVGGKNLFPSNIAGLPTWFTIRANHQGYTARSAQTDMMVAMNLQTVAKDIKQVKANGIFLYNSDLKFDPVLLRDDCTNIGISFRELASGLSSSIKLKKLLTNMIYVGIVARLVHADKEVLDQVIKDNFSDKPKVIDSNLQAATIGWDYAEQHLQPSEFPLKLEAMDANQGKMLIDGNTAAALGLVYGGCTFVSWYPITPSSSLIEAFIKYAARYRKDPDGTSNYAVLQAEDELAAVSMVLGASWAGSRAMTATSGPGFSLMSEAAGYSYYAEIPAVIWDIQRVGPSTGMPTRTQQGDILNAATMSHGDTRHILLFPAHPEECFEFGQTAFDLAERLQTLVLVLSDLDIGMNFWITKKFELPQHSFDRGKVLSAQELEQRPDYKRFKDYDDDGITYRSLPGTKHPLSAYLTRGSGHNWQAQYTEDPDEYQDLVDRLEKKFQTARSLVPKPEVYNSDQAATGIIAFGSSDIAVEEARAQLKEEHNFDTAYLRLRAYPFTTEVKEFLDRYDTIFVVEQNRDAQILNLINKDLPNFCSKLRSVRHYNGQPIDARTISQGILGQKHQKECV